MPIYLDNKTDKKKNAIRTGRGSELRDEVEKKERERERGKERRSRRRKHGKENHARTLISRSFSGEHSPFRYMVVVGGSGSRRDRRNRARRLCGKRSRRAERRRNRLPAVKTLTGLGQDG